MADGDVPVPAAPASPPKLSELLVLGQRLASRPRDPQAPPDRTTYLLRRPSYCGRNYRNDYGDKVSCTAEVERLPNGLPTSRCGRCREREMTAAMHDKHEAQRRARAEQEAARGGRRRTDFEPEGNR